MNDNIRMPLSGIRVVELATVVAAPTTSRMLCAYGADVIKVETVYGDEMRRTGKTEMAPYEDDFNPLFTVHNSNKKLVSINFKTEEGKEALLKLIGTADVFISNVRAPSLKRNGLDYESLRDRFPELIYAHFSGFGPKGPSATDPGFDSTAFWLRSGPMADWQVEGSFPFVPTYAFGDMATSSVLLSGILMALIAREKTGKGTKVETSLFASGIWCNSVGIVATQFDRKHLNPDPLWPSDPFDNYYQCADGKWMGVYANEYIRDKEKFAKLFGMEDILTDERYNDIDTLHESGVLPEGVERVKKVFLTKTSTEWREIFCANNISCEIMQRTCDVVSDPQAIENHYVEKLEFTEGSSVVMPCPPVHFSEYTRRDYEPTGRIGRDTDEVFAALGYSSAEIEAMRDKGAIV